MLDLYYQRCRNDFLKKYDDDFLYNFKKSMDVKVITKNITITDISDIFKIYFGNKYKIKKSSFRPKISKFLGLSPLHMVFHWNVLATNKTKKYPSMTSLDNSFVLTKNIILSINLAYRDSMNEHDYMDKSQMLLNCISDLNNIFLNNFIE